MPKNVSNRVWKDTQSERSSAIAKGNKSRIGWNKRVQLQRNVEIGKKMEAEILQQRVDLKKAEAERREFNRIRREEKEKMAEIVQKISAAKLKRMKKKQLRQLKKA